MKLTRLVPTDQGFRPLVIRNYTLADIPQLIDIQRECFPPPFPSELWWNEEQLTNHVTIFPAGALCAEIDGQLVGSMTAVRTMFDPDQPENWATATDQGYIKGAFHPQGNALYVVDISVRPGWRKAGIGRALMEAMYATVVHLSVERLVGGGRLPGYQRYQDQLSAQEYVEQVLAGKIADPVVTFLLKCGRTPLALVPDYLEDEESGNYGLLMEWRNPFLQT